MSFLVHTILFCIFAVSYVLFKDNLDESHYMGLLIFLALIYLCSAALLISLQVKLGTMKYVGEALLTEALSDENRPVSHKFLNLILGLFLSLGFPALLFLFEKEDITHTTEFGGRHLVAMTLGVFLYYLIRTRIYLHSIPRN